MADFQALRAFLEERQMQFRQAVEGSSEFEREFTNLQSSWQTIHDQTVLQEMTVRAMCKYPPVWQALLSAGLVQQVQQEMYAARVVDTSLLNTSMVSIDEDSSQDSLSNLQATSQAESLSYPRSTSASPQQLRIEPIGDNTMHNEQHASQRTYDRLAIWDKKIVTGKEIVTGIMGSAIVVVTLTVAIIAIFSASNAETYAAAKDILLFLNGLVGVVLGYYFGRVPGEARAEKAENETRKARSDLDRTVGEVRGILDESTVVTDRSRQNGEIILIPAQVEHLRRLLREH
jgi:hypothetical protein